MAEAGKIVQARAQYDSAASFVVARANIGIRYQRYKTAHALVTFRAAERAFRGESQLFEREEGQELCAVNSVAEMQAHTRINEVERISCGRIFSVVHDSVYSYHLCRQCVVIFVFCTLMV